MVINVPIPWQKIASRKVGSVFLIYFFWYVDTVFKGRFPYVEIRKLNPEESKEIIEKEPSVDAFSEKKDPFLVEDHQTGDEGFNCHELTVESPLNLESSTLENETRVRVFVYGVRCHLSLGILHFHIP